MSCENMLKLCHGVWPMCVGEIDMKKLCSHQIQPQCEMQFTEFGRSSVRKSAYHISRRCCFTFVSHHVSVSGLVSTICVLIG